MKRVLSLIIALAMLLGLLPMSIVTVAVKAAQNGSEENVLTTAWPVLNTDLTHVICYGQSFSTGSDAPYYNDPTVDNVYVYGGITNSANGTELKHLTASAGNQHPIISAGNVLAKLLTAAGIDTDIVLGSYGSGGKTIAQLMSAERQAEIKEEEGYTYDILSSGRYAVFQNSVSALAQYAQTNAQSISCPAIVYLQGETDQNTDAQLGYPENPARAGYGAGGDKEKYKEYMSRLKEDMQREIMEQYGQTEKPLFIIYQVSGTYTRTQYSSINMAQIEFAQENEDVILVQSPYFTSHYTNSHHLTQNGYRWLGEYIGRTIYTALVEREKPWPMLPESIEITDENTVRITVSGMQNGLTIDTWTVENASNSKNLYGFYLQADGKNIVPAKVSVHENIIELTLSTSLTSETVYVYYAGRHASGTGNIRDNCAELGFYEYLDDSDDTGTGNNQGVSHSALDADGNSIIGQKYPLYNWLASFCYEVEVPEPVQRQAAYYHWEMQETGLVSVTEGNATENNLTLVQGSVDDGVLNKVQYTMEKAIVLEHDRPWVIEWKAGGNGNSYYGGKFLSTTGSESCAQYLYLPADSRGMVAWGVGSDSANYGFQLGKRGIDTRTEHTYRIENRIADDGVNTVYLIVDGVEIGAMTTGYRTSANSSGSAGSMIEEPKNWANGKDIFMNCIGASGSFLLNNMKLSYLKVWEAGQHTHTYTSTVTAPTCTEGGYTTYTCTCGDSYVGNYSNAAGHRFDSIVCTVCGNKYPDKVTELDSALAVTMTPENYLTISNPFAEKLACAPNLLTYGNGNFAVAYLADDVNTVETESSTTIVCRLGLFDVDAPENGTFFDIATAGQTIGSITIGCKAPYEPNLLKLNDDTLLVLFNIRDTAGNYVYYSATFDIATNTVTSYQPLTLDGKSWTPANIAASYNALAENDISTSGPASSMVFTSKIIQHEGYYYGYCGGICSGFGGMLVRSTDGINWTSVMAPEALPEMKGVIECGFEFLDDYVYFCMRDISSGVYHCSYDFKTGEQLTKVSKLSGITTSKPTAFIQDGNLYLIVNKATGDDNTVGRRNTALFYRVNPKTCRLTLVRQVFCADGVAYHSVVNYNGINYWSFHTDARRINPYTQGRSNLAFLQIPKLYAAEGGSADGVLDLNDYSDMFARGCITGASNTWQASAVNMHYQIPMVDFADFDTVTITANSEKKAYIAFFTDRMTQNGTIAYAEGWTEQLVMEPGTVKTLNIPEDAAYLYILNNNAAGANLLPESVVFSKTETEQHTHSYTPTVTAPTCTEQGYTTYTCECGDSYVDDYVDVRPLNILLIGNSFSWDAADFWYDMQTSMTYDTMKAMLADPYDVHLAVMYKGSATLGYHATCAANNTGTYTFQEIGPETNYVWRPSDGKNANNKILEHLQARDWDIIVIQSYQHEADGTPPRSTYTGGNDKFIEPSASLGFLLDYFAQNEPGAEVYYYMPWSSVKFYGADGTAAGYEAIGKYSQEQIIYMTGTTSGKKLAGIIPVGTAIENARTTYLHKLSYTAGTGATALLQDPQIGLLYDTQHLSFGVGRYIAGLTVAQSVIPQEMRKTTISWPSVKESPSVGILPEEYSVIARKAVENAMQNPYVITPISGYDTDLATRVGNEITGTAFAGSELTDEVSVRSYLETMIQNLLASYGDTEYSLTISEFELKNGEIWNLEAEAIVRIGYSAHTGQISVTEGSSHQFGEWVCISMPTADGPGLEQRVCTKCGYVDSKDVEGSWQKYDLANHLQELPENYCAEINLWNLLKPESVMINHLGDWVSAGATVYSVTIPVKPGDRIYANSFGVTDNKKGIQVSFIGDYGIIKTTFSSGTYKEFTNNGGYLIAPEGTIAVNVPVWDYRSENTLKILNREHQYIASVTAPTCTEQGYTTYTCACGDSYVDSYVDATGHADDNGTCATCGEKLWEHGDANGDGVVDGKDVLLLRKYMANYDYDLGIADVEVSAGADANGDGVVNGKDLLLLRRYMANYDFETGKSTIVLGP